MRLCIIWVRLGPIWILITAPHVFCLDWATTLKLSWNPQEQCSTVIYQMSRSQLLNLDLFKISTPVFFLGAVICRGARFKHVAGWLWRRHGSVMDLESLTWAPASKPSTSHRHSHYISSSCGRGSGGGLPLGLLPLPHRTVGGFAFFPDCQEMPRPQDTLGLPYLPSLELFHIYL